PLPQARRMLLASWLSASASLHVDDVPAPSWQSVNPWPPLYLFRIVRKSATALSFFHCGSSGSLRKAIEVEPSVCSLLLARLAIVMVFVALETALTKTSGRQPSTRADE